MKAQFKIDTGLMLNREIIFGGPMYDIHIDLKDVGSHQAYEYRLRKGSTMTIDDVMYTGKSIQNVNGELKIAGEPNCYHFVEIDAWVYVPVFDDFLIDVSKIPENAEAFFYDNDARDYDSLLTSSSGISKGMIL